PGEHVIQYIARGAQFRIGDELFERELVYSDAAFTSIFTVERLSGSMSLDDRSRVLISDRLATAYFGTTEATGRPLTQLVNGEPREFTVGGVFKQFPANSSFRFQL